MKVNVTLLGRQNDEFVKKVRSQGYRQLVSGKLVKIMDESNTGPVTFPVLLSATGTKLAVGGTPHYQTFYDHYEADLNAIFTGI